MLETIKEAVKTLAVAAIVFVCVVWPLFTSEAPPDEETLKAVAEELVEQVAKLAAAVIALVAYIKSLLKKEELEVQRYRIQMDREVAGLAHNADMEAIKTGVSARGGVKKK